ncbi:MAG: hypothetical protein ACR2FG_12885 [Marmoricola sp.]
MTTMDLLPTLVALAEGGDLSDVIGPLDDGESLVPLLDAQPPTRDTVTAEYLAEGAVAPVVMDLGKLETMARYPRVERPAHT